jgi:hypothetical protein
MAEFLVLALEHVKQRLRGQLVSEDQALTESRAVHT